MKKVSKTRVFIWILAVAPLVLVAAVYGALPEMIPTNWGFDGNVSYGEKSTLWMLAAMSPVMAAMFRLLPKIDPRKKNYKKFIGFYDGFCFVMMAFMLGMTALIVSESLNPGRISVQSAVIAACGALFVFMGNMLPKVKSNFFIGIRTPWALSDNEVWNKTHRLAGYLYFYGGIIIAVLAFFINDLPMFVVMMGIVAAASLVPTVMSYMWYRKLTCCENSGEAEDAE